MSCGFCHWLKGPRPIGKRPACKCIIESEVHIMHHNDVVMKLIERETYIESLKNETLVVTAKAEKLSDENKRLLAENTKLLEEVAPWRTLHPLTVSLIKMAYNLK